MWAMASRLDDATIAALAAYYAYSESLWQPVAGLHETLDALRQRGLRLGLISNAGDGRLLSSPTLSLLAGNAGARPAPSLVTLFDSFF